MRRNLLLFLAVAFVATPLGRASAQTPQQARAVTTPKEHFGFNICDDYCLANYKQLEAYWHKIEGQTDRMKVVNIGKTEEGRDQLMAIISSPANLAKLDHYKSISRRLALAKDLTDDDAHKLAAEGKAIIWIDGGLHASEVLCAQVLVETVYRLVTANDAETKRFLDDVILLYVHCNPDGMDLCADSYMKSNTDPTQRRGYGNRLYEKYAGHDDNRDSYACNLAETRNMNRVMYRDWFPQMAFDHHQTGPAGAVLFIPPCRDPNNYNLHPMVLNGIEALSSAMRDRLLTENKPGATVRTGAGYSLWWNGGVITTCQFHNMIGIFTETIGGPTPTSIPLSINKLLPNYDYLSPIPPQPWHFKQSMEYSISTNRATLDFASRNRERLLYGIYHMGKDAIDAGNRDSWTIEPHMILAAGGSTSRSGRGGRGGGGGGGGGRGGAGGGGAPAEFVRLFHKPEQRDPRGFIMPADQPDFLNATRFVNKLLNTGITIHRATADFEVAGKKYPKGSYVVKSAQAFRPHVLDMFEPQDHPDDFAPGSTTPTAPYDIAGYTLAFQMAVKFDRILDGFDGPFEEIKTETVAPPAASIMNASASAGFFLDTRINDAFRAVNRLLAAGEEVHRLTKPINVGGIYVVPAGTFFITRKASTQAAIEKIAKDLGMPFTGTAVAPAKDATVALKPARIGLSDTGNSMPAGWTRWVLEQFEFPYTTFAGNALNQGNLHDKYDVLVFVESGIGGGGGGRGGAGGGRGGAGGARGGRGGAGGGAGGAGGGAGGAGGGAGGAGGGARGGAGGAGGDQPPAGADQEQPNNAAIANVKKFIEDGGIVFMAGQPTTNTATQLGLPLGNHLAGIGRDKFYVPGSVLRTKVDPTDWVAWGMDADLDVMFNNSPTFKIPEGDAAKGLKKVAMFDTKKPLRSGWAFGQDHLDGGVAVAEAAIGKGHLVLCGPQVLFRGEPDGTFKFLFNSIIQSGHKD